MCDVVIIGCGASGIVSSIFAKNKENKVTILERNSVPLKKLLMTGNGKCNYLNEIYSTKNYHSADISIVDKIISTENIDSVRNFFDNLGIVPNIKNGYYYPFSGQAITIKNALLKEAICRGVEIKYDCLVKNIKKIDNKFVIEYNDSILECNKLIIATGSCAYPKTGSDGMGYNFLEKFGHTIVKPLPALVGLESNFKYLKDWDGVRSQVRVELFEDDKFISQEVGEIQLTS